MDLRNYSLGHCLVIKGIGLVNTAKRQEKRVSTFFIWVPNRIIQKGFARKIQISSEFDQQDFYTFKDASIFTMSAITQASNTIE